MSKELCCTVQVTTYRTSGQVDQVHSANAFYNNNEFDEASASAFANVVNALGSHDGGPSPWLVYGLLAGLYNADTNVGLAIELGKAWKEWTGTYFFDECVSVTIDWDKVRAEEKTGLQTGLQKGSPTGAQT